MDPLRLALLLVGLMIIGAVFAWGMLRNRKPNRPEDTYPSEGVGWGMVPERGQLAEDDLEAVADLRHGARRESVEPGDLQISSVQGDGRGPDPGVLEAAPQEQSNEHYSLLISMAVLAPEGEPFLGEDLLEVFDGAGLYFGDMNIFHAPVDLEKTDGPALFSVANLVEPGTLEPERIGGLRTPGILLFAQLPATVPGTEVLDHMLATGRHLAKTLGGDLCGQRREPLTPQVVEYLRAEIKEEIGDRVEKPDDLF